MSDPRQDIPRGARARGLARASSAGGTARPSSRASRPCAGGRSSSTAPRSSSPAPSANPRSPEWRARRPSPRAWPRSRPITPTLPPRTSAQKSSPPRARTSARRTPSMRATGMLEIRIVRRGGDHLALRRERRPRRISPRPGRRRRRFFLSFSPRRRRRLRRHARVATNLATPVGSSRACNPPLCFGPLLAGSPRGLRGAQPLHDVLPRRRELVHRQRRERLSAVLLPHRGDVPTRIHHAVGARPPGVGG